MKPGKRIRSIPLSTLAAIALTFIWTSIAAAFAAVQPQDIPRMLADKGKKLSAVKAALTVTTSYDGGKSLQNIKGFLLYRRPMDFRFQGVGPGGNSLFELVFKGAGFELFVPSDGKILKGTKGCFARRFPDVAELQGLIPLALLQWRGVKFKQQVSSDKKQTVIRLSFQGDTWEATLDNSRLLVTRLVRMGPNGSDLTADFGDFSSGDHGWLPRRFRVQSRSGGWRTLVKMHKIKINPYLVERNFKLETTFSPSIEKCR
jgi:outer membrane lipoprotein-sorting protein